MVQEPTATRSGGWTQQGVSFIIVRLTAKNFHRNHCTLLRFHLFFPFKLIKTQFRKVLSTFFSKRVAPCMTPGSRLSSSRLSIKRKHPFERKILNFPLIPWQEVDQVDFFYASRAGENRVANKQSITSDYRSLMTALSARISITRSCGCLLFRWCIFLDVCPRKWLSFFFSCL